MEIPTIRKVSPVVDVGTTATDVYTISSNRKARLKKIWAHNTSTTDVEVTILDATGSAATPPLKVLAGQTVVLGEQEVPQVEFTSKIQASASATGVKLQIEVEEF